MDGEKGKVIFIVRGHGCQHMYISIHIKSHTILATMPARTLPTIAHRNPWMCHRHWMTTLMKQLYSPLMF